MITIRYLGGGRGVKLISWYIAHVDEETQIGTGRGEPEKFRVELFGYREALTFQEDRDIVRQALGYCCCDVWDMTTGKVVLRNLVHSSC
jgi:hypothetical protein